MLNLYKLEIFSTVVQTGSFSAAAGRLYMTQPAISQHIQDLENSVGTVLFKRGRRGVTLTQSGEVLHNYTVRILALVAEAEGAVTQVENLADARMTIGATPGVNIYLLPDWLKNFREAYPNINVVLQTSVTAGIVREIMSHKLDVGFVEGELDNLAENGLESMVLQPIPLRVVVGKGHDWCQHAAISPEMLNQQPFIMRQSGSQTRAWVDELLRDYDIQPRIVAEFDNPESIKHAVMSNMGMTILPEYAIQREQNLKLLRAVPLEGVHLERSLKLVWDGGTPFTPLQRALLRYLGKRFPQVKKLPGPTGT